MKKQKIYFILIISILFYACAQHKTTEEPKNPQPPEWSYNKTIYEVNIRQFSEAGTFKEFEKDLPRLKEMGIGIIWLMPIHPIGEKNRKGTLGSYYSVKDYKGINSDLGTKEDFKDLVVQAHELGIYVILDWVANHTAWDHPWTVTNKEFYNLDSTGSFMPPVSDWSDVIDLNYEEKELWTAMIDALKYWVEEFDIDGYRCDVAAMVPFEFWKEARYELDKIKPVFMLAEGHETELHENGFDMTYAWNLKDVMNNYAKGKAVLADIKDHFYTVEKEYPENAFIMNFTTNHDENSWDGTVYERLGKLAMPFSVLISTAPGMPLVYSGQEAGLNKRLEFFEKDPIQWTDHIQGTIFKKIFNEKINNRALWNGKAGGKINFLENKENQNILAFYREKEKNKVLVLINLSDKESTFLIEDEKAFDEYKDLFRETEISITHKTELSIEPYDFIVLIK